MLLIVLAILRRRRVPRPDLSIHEARRRRPGTKVLLCLVPLAAIGCKTVTHREASRPKQAPGAEAGMTVPAQDTATPTASNSSSDPHAARTAFQNKVTKEQQYNVHLELGRFQEGQENFELALSEYQKALEACEAKPLTLDGVKGGAKRAMAHRRMGSALDRLGRFEQAENHYRTALKLSPNDPKVWNDAGYSYYLQGRWADSERALKTADSLDPNDSRILTNLGLTLAASGKTDDALAAFAKAGGKAVGHANLAYILAAMGKTELARKHYQTALEYQPDLGAARIALNALDAKAATGPQTQIAAARPPSVHPTGPAAGTGPGQPLSVSIPPPRPAPRVQTSSVRVPAPSDAALNRTSATATRVIPPPVGRE